MNCLFAYLSSLLTTFFFLAIDFLTYLLEATKPGFGFLGVDFMLFMFCYGCMFAFIFAFVVLDVVFSAKPRDWLGRTSPKMTYFVSGGT